MILNPRVTPDLYLEGAATRQTGFFRGNPGPRALLNAVERLANSYDAECDRVRQDLMIAESQVRDYQTRLCQPFLHDDYLSELTALRNQLKAGLSGTPPGEETDAAPSTSDLADAIKTLKAAHTIDALSERTEKRASSVEEPVTVRIQRRRQNLAAS